MYERLYNKVLSLRTGLLLAALLGLAAAPPGGGRRGPTAAAYLYATAGLVWARGRNRTLGGFRGLT